MDDILSNMGYNLPADYLEKNLEYYLARTSHGSTLSRVVHAQLAEIIGDRELSWDLYSGALGSDYMDIQGGTTAEGIHAGVMAGTIMIAVSTYAGVDLRGDLLSINPALPHGWKTMSFNLHFKGVNYRFEISTYLIEITSTKDSVILVNGKEFKLDRGKVLMLDL